MREEGAEVKKKASQDGGASAQEPLRTAKVVEERVPLKREQAVEQAIDALEPQTMEEVVEASKSLSEASCRKRRKGHPDPDNALLDAAIE